jgi:hypothetical protein
VRLRLSKALLTRTFEQLRNCGGGRRECQVLWVGPWADPLSIDRVLHPKHTATAAHIHVEDDWISSLWMMLADEHAGVRVQVHTHPGDAYHSATDDAFPAVHTTGFLSLVIPNFAQGQIGFDRAFLARLDEVGTWREVSIPDYLEVNDDR